MINNFIREYLFFKEFKELQPNYFFFEESDNYHIRILFESESLLMDYFNLKTDESETLEVSPSSSSETLSSLITFLSTYKNSQ